MTIIGVFLSNLFRLLVVFCGQTRVSRLYWGSFHWFRPAASQFFQQDSRAVSSVGRAPHLQCGGQEFESPTVHHSGRIKLINLRICPRKKLPFAQVCPFGMISIRGKLNWRKTLTQSFNTRSSLWESFYQTTKENSPNTIKK